MEIYDYYYISPHRDICNLVLEVGGGWHADFLPGLVAYSMFPQSYYVFFPLPCILTQMLLTGPSCSDSWISIELCPSFPYNATASGHWSGSLLSNQLCSLILEFQLSWLSSASGLRMLPNSSPSSVHLYPNSGILGAPTLTCSILYIHAHCWVPAYLIYRFQSHSKYFASRLFLGSLLPPLYLILSTQQGI